MPPAASAIELPLTVPPIVSVPPAVPPMRSSIVAEMETVPDLYVVPPALAAWASITAPAATVTVAADSKTLTPLAVEWEFASLRVASILALASTVSVVVAEPAVAAAIEIEPTPCSAVT